MDPALKTDALSQRIYRNYLIGTVPTLIPLAYLLSALIRVQSESMRAALVVGVPILLIFAGLLPFLIIRMRVGQAMHGVPNEEGGARLNRLLTLPRRIELDVLSSFMGGSLIYAAWGVWRQEISAGVFLFALFLTASLNMLIGIRMFLQMEKDIHPYCLEEFKLHPDAEVQGDFMHWPRLSWYLTFAFIAILVGALAGLGSVTYSRGYAFLKGTIARLEAEGQTELAEFMYQSYLGMFQDMALPMAGVGTFILAIAIMAAWQLGQRLKRASIHIQQSVMALAEGAPTIPDWVSTDEFGDLSRGLARVFSRLEGIASSLRNSATQLATSAAELGGSTDKQNETLARQASALQETEVTAQEIKQTSLLAAQKTEAVLRTAERAEEISREGESAVEQSLAGLTDIRDEVAEMAGTIRSLGERARQIATITVTVKDLADQSNMLALNAAIEAVRSGEHGKGFAVVAREIRSLADQSIQATNRVREILEDITDAIRGTVTITERGSDKIQVSLVQMQNSGESLRELSGIVRDNANAVRQIAAAVGQQNVGIGQIFEAVKDLSRMMDDTMERLRATDGAASLVRIVAEEVSGVVVRYGVGEVEGLEPEKTVTVNKQSGAA